MAATTLLAILLTCTVEANSETLTQTGATKLVELVDLAGLADTLAGGEFTVFAPTNTAISKLPMATLAVLLGDQEALTKVLLDHVVTGKTLSNQLSNDMIVPTAGGGSLRVNIYCPIPHYRNITTVNGALVSMADIPAGDTVIHLVSSVLPSTPPTTITDIINTEERFSTLRGALDSLGLLDALNGEGPFTLFAPTNKAFAAVPKEALAAMMADQEAFKNFILNHVVPGTVFKEGLSWVTRTSLAPSDKISTQSYQNGSVKVLIYMGGKLALSAWLTQFDLLASNGVIHSFDSPNLY